MLQPASAEEVVMRGGVFVFVAARLFLASPQASVAETYRAWTFVLRSDGPVISAAVEAIPAGHAVLGPAFGRSLIIGCHRGTLTGTLHASTRQGIEPLSSSGMAMNTARVGLSFDGEPMTFGVWRREFDSVFPPDDFFERLERAREALVEVAVNCNGCGAPARVRLRIPTDGFAEALAALRAACGT
jgi:hypothetical protein